MINREDVLKALSNVMDPDLGKDLVTLGMIQDVNITENKIAFSVVLTTPACPLKEMLKKDCLNAIEGMGLDDVEVEINMTSTVTTTRADNLPLLPNPHASHT